MKTRPKLQAGDVVKANKNKLSRGRKPRIFRFGEETAVVVRASSLNSHEGKFHITIENSHGRMSVKRELLWKTGYNIHNAQKPVQVVVVKPPKKVVPLDTVDHLTIADRMSNRCTCALETIMNFGCKCGGN